MHRFDQSLRVDVIVSGKLRRYNHLTIAQQLSNVRTIVLPNIIDAGKVGIGFVQSFVKLLAWRPDVVFTKGGYVCLPIGLAAKALRIPLVIHDSDAHPGLTNRLLARWATRIGTGAPLKFYPYPTEISQYVGVPVRSEFRHYSVEERTASKQTLGFDPTRPLVVITGGGLGAKRLNDAIAISLDELLPKTNVLLISGEGQYNELRAITPEGDTRFQLHAFVTEGMAEMLSAADVVVARAGATTILELAALAKPTILVPNGFLSGGHQLKNAAVYAEKQAVSVVDELTIEQQPTVLADEILNVLADPSRMKQMGDAFHSFAKPHAAHDMAQMVLDSVRRK